MDARAGGESVLHPGALQVERGGSVGGGVAEEGVPVDEDALLEGGGDLDNHDATKGCIGLEGVVDERESVDMLPHDDHSLSEEARLRLNEANSRRGLLGGEHREEVGEVEPALPEGVG